MRTALIGTRVIPANPSPINAHGGSKCDHMTCEGAGSRLDVARATVEHKVPSDVEVMYGTALRAKPQ